MRRTWRSSRVTRAPSLPCRSPRTGAPPSLGRSPRALLVLTPCCQFGFSLVRSGQFKIHMLVVSCCLARSQCSGCGLQVLSGDGGCRRREALGPSQAKELQDADALRGCVLHSRIWEHILSCTARYCDFKQVHAQYFRHRCNSVLLPFSAWKFLKRLLTVVIPARRHRRVGGCI